MSILLKALKKSEAQRQVGQPPDILAPADESNEQKTNDRGWLTTGLLLVVAGLLGYYGWQYFFPADEADVPAVAEQEERANEVVEEAESESPSAPVMAAADGVDRPPVVANFPTAEPTETDDNEQRREELNRSFAEFQAEQPEQESSEPENPVPEPAESLANSEERMVSNLQDLNSFETIGAKSSDPYAEEADDDDPTYRPRNSRRAPEPGGQAANSEPISFWQLPQDMRDRMPEFRITVLVYAETPEDRFLLINGARLKEQDELEPGLILNEIRRDGAVFTFRNYRFLVKG